jgi:hypothetical protein
MKIRTSIAIAALGLSFAAPSVFADNSQQSKMTTCNAQAAGKTADDRKAFMKTCLSSSPAAAATPMTQQQKMSACSQSNKGKKGDDYKASMKSCLSAHG